MMNSTTIQQPVKTETNKPAIQVTELNLDQILAQVWNEGLPNGIFNLH
ncbi:MAG: hypothetical protein AAF383_24630 [Cyanobacteria bacterium P01_A01_bin.83]